MILEYTVKDNSKTLKEILKKEFNISNRLLIRLKQSNKINCNGISVPICFPITIGDIIHVEIDFEETSENIVPTKMDLDIIYEDDCYLVINKPANLAVHPSCYHFSDSLSNGIQFYFQSIGLNKKIRPVNRLDKDTTRYCYFRKK